MYQGHRDSRPAEILLVEDDPADVLLCGSFEGGGCRPLLPACGESMAKQPLTFEKRAKPHTKALPVIVVTSSKAPADVLRMYELNANSHVQKPTDLGEMF